MFNLFTFQNKFNFPYYGVKSNAFFPKLILKLQKKLLPLFGSEEVKNIIVAFQNNFELIQTVYIDICGIKMLKN